MAILGDANSTVQLDGSTSLPSTWSHGSAVTYNGISFYDYHNSAMGSSTVADLLIQTTVKVI